MVIKTISEDLWATLKDILQQADQTWEMEDTRMKYVTIQINKIDIEDLRKILNDR